MSLVNGWVSAGPRGCQRGPEGHTRQPLPATQHGSKGPGGMRLGLWDNLRLHGSLQDCNTKLGDCRTAVCLNPATQYPWTKVDRWDRMMGQDDGTGSELGCPSPPSAACSRRPTAPPAQGPRSTASAAAAAAVTAGAHACIGCMRDQGFCIVGHKPCWHSCSVSSGRTSQCLHACEGSCACPALAGG